MTKKETTRKSGGSSLNSVRIPTFRAKTTKTKPTTTSTPKAHWTKHPEYLSLWDGLAKKRKVRLPRIDAKLTTAGMRRWLRLQLKTSVTAFQKEYPDQNIREFIKNNPEWTLKAWAGSVLEMKDYLGK